MNQSTKYSINKLDKNAKKYKDKMQKEKIQNTCSCGSLIKHKQHNKMEECMDDIEGRMKTAYRKGHKHFMVNPYTDTFIFSEFIVRALVKHCKDNGLPDTWVFRGYGRPMIVFNKYSSEEKLLAYVIGIH
jgi:hypothetical protein